ncbi:MAG: RNA-binding protein [Candidatus Pacearchaeota archaeon]|nr:MAG: RNA-binding protein [Candidatus Pacearchaeota archaeon]
MEKEEKKTKTKKIEKKEIKEEKEVEKKEVKKVEIERKKREMVVPGEVVAKGAEFLPSDGTRREGEEVIATRFGLLEKTDRLVKIIPLSGVYIPRVGNTVIGQVIDITFNGWIIDVVAPNIAFLSVAECAGYINKKDLAEHFGFRDNIVTKIKSIKLKGIDLTMKERGLRKLEGGIIVRINPTRVPRVIGRAGSMVNTIKSETGCSITVGQNGVIWVKGKNPEDELLAKKAIDLIVQKPFIEGLTEKVKEFLIEQKKKPKIKEKEKEKEK